MGHDLVQGMDTDIPHMSVEEPAAQQAAELFRGMDRDQDGLVSSSCGVPCRDVLCDVSSPLLRPCPAQLTAELFRGMEREQDSLLSS